MPLITLPKPTWTPSPNYSARSGGAKIRLIVIHDCEGSLLGSVSWFAMAASQVSAHYILSEDGAKVVQMVHLANKAWHACNANSFSIGIEAAGYAAKGLGEPEWEALAALTAFHLRVFGIPCQRATAANNWTGYCEHWQLGQMGGGHHDITDPSASVLRLAFDVLVKKAYALDMPAVWGPDRVLVTPAPKAPEGWTSPHPGARHGFDEGSLEWAQAKLNALNIPKTSLLVDGLYGPHTNEALSVFQLTHNLSVSGELDAPTIKALKAL